MTTLLSNTKSLFTSSTDGIIGLPTESAAIPDVTPGCDIDAPERGLNSRGMNSSGSSTPEVGMEDGMTTLSVVRG
jgi:hypothetical protein